jgi:RNA-binding protein YlmH
MTDTSKYKNITVTHKTYNDLDSLRDKILDPNLKLSRSQAVTYLVNEKKTKLNGKVAHGKNKA